MCLITWLMATEHVDSDTQWRGNLQNELVELAQIEMLTQLERTLRDVYRFQPKSPKGTPKGGLRGHRLPDRVSLGSV